MAVGTLTIFIQNLPMGGTKSRESEDRYWIGISLKKRDPNSAKTQGTVLGRSFYDKVAGANFPTKNSKTQIRKPVGA